MKKVIFITGVYDTIDLFTSEIEKVFMDWGYECLVLDANHMKESLKEFAVFAATPVAAAVTFNNLGYNLELIEGQSIWEQYDIPYVNILMDHPFHYRKPLENMPKTAKVFCTDENHVEFVKRFFPNITFCEFLPHAGIEINANRKPIKDRTIDVLYAGALPFYTAGRLVPDLSAVQQFDAIDMCQKVLKELTSNPEKTTEEVIEAYLLGCDMSDKELLDSIVKMRFLDSYATSFFREQSVRILVEHGIDVTAYGTGWNQCEWSDNPHLHYGGKVLAPDILPLMCDSKIVLNTMTWYKAGSHDRVFNGMLARAGVVTDTSAYMDREFTSGKELFLFRLKELEKLPDMIRSLLEDEKGLQEVADCGYEVAKTKHVWKNRMETIISFF